MVEQVRSRARLICYSLSLFLIKIHLIYSYHVEELLKSSSHLFTFSGCFEERGLSLVWLIAYSSHRLDHIGSFIPHCDLFVLNPCNFYCFYHSGVWRHIRFQSGSWELSESEVFFPQVGVCCLLGLCSCVSVQIFRLVQAVGFIWFSEDVKDQDQPGLPILFWHITSIQTRQYFSINIKSTQPGLRQSKLFKMECTFPLFFFFYWKLWYLGYFASKHQVPVLFWREQLNPWLYLASRC